MTKNLVLHGYAGFQCYGDRSIYMDHLGWGHAYGAEFAPILGASVKVTF